MKNGIQKKILYLVTLCVLLLTPIIQSTVYLLSDYGYIKDNNYINPAIIIFIAVPFLLYIYIHNLIKTRCKLDVFDYLFFVLIIIGIIVCLGSIDIYTSFLGRSNRHDGFLSLLCYNLLLINWKKMGNKHDLENWYKIIIYIAIFNVAYSLLQVYTDYKFIVRTGADMTASGFCGHNNFFGSLMVTALSMVSCKFLSDKRNNLKNILVIMFLFIGLINCQSSGPFLAYVVTLIFIIVFLAIKKSLIIKKFIFLIVIPIVLLGSVLMINKFVFKSEVCELCDIKANVIDNGGHDRLKIWKRTFTVVKKHPILGVGYDNLAYIYPNPYPNIQVKPSGIVVTGEILNKKYYLVDNAHNVYLQTLVCSGIIGLSQYILLCLFILIKGCRTKKKVLFIFMSGFVAYSTQAFFNINVITVVPIYYLIMGLLLVDNNIEN